MIETSSSVEIDRRIAAPIERVWHAWTDPSTYAQWISPNPDLPVTATTDLVTGGSWAVVMGPYAVRGEYLRIDAPRLLEFTWRFDHEPDVAPSVVTVELTDDEGATLLRLVHTGFADEDDRSGNLEGWHLCLPRLDALLSR